MLFATLCKILKFSKTIDFFGFCHPGAPGLASRAPTPHSPLAPRLASLACPIARFARPWPKNALKYTLGAFTMHFTSFGTLLEFSIFFGFQDLGARSARRSARPDRPGSLRSKNSKIHDWGEKIHNFKNSKR